ncbi:hypothetical protein EDB84DRAFT_1444788 [Lactarius hengduanensis]|nr:hypothetical protein EDB84DRAFT_1444788 [Lactarius hengduanensis]
MDGYCPLVQASGAPALATTVQNSTVTYMVNLMGIPLRLAPSLRKVSLLDLENEGLEIDGLGGDVGDAATGDAAPGTKYKEANALVKALISAAEVLEKGCGKFVNEPYRAEPSPVMARLPTPLSPLPKRSSPTFYRLRTYGADRVVCALRPWAGVEDVRGRLRRGLNDLDVQIHLGGGMARVVPSSVDLDDGEGLSDADFTSPAATLPERLRGICRCARGVKEHRRCYCQRVPVQCGIPANGRLVSLLDTALARVTDMPLITSSSVFGYGATSSATCSSDKCAPYLHRSSDTCVSRVQEDAKRRNRTRRPPRGEPPYRYLLCSGTRRSRSQVARAAHGCGTLGDAKDESVQLDNRGPDARDRARLRASRNFAKLNRLSGMRRS